MSYTRATSGGTLSSTDITGSGDLPWTYATGVELLDLSGDPTYPPVKADGVYAITTVVRAVTTEDGKNFRAQLNLAPDAIAMFTAGSGKTVSGVPSLFIPLTAVVELNAGDVMEMSITTDAVGAVTCQFNAIIVKLA